MVGATESKGSVLVVDDDPILLEVMRIRLSRAGWQVHLREQALGTAQWISHHRPDIVLLDVSMPAITGDGLVAALRRTGLSDEVGIILHSGLSTDQLEPLIEATGVLGAIQKSGNDELFLTEFDALVSRHRRARAGRRD